MTLRASIVCRVNKCRGLAQEEQSRLVQFQSRMPLETCQEDFRWIQVMNMAAAVERQVVVQRWLISSTMVEFRLVIYRDLLVDRYTTIVFASPLIFLCFGT